MRSSLLCKLLELNLSQSLVYVFSFVRSQGCVSDQAQVECTHLHLACSVRHVIHCNPACMHTTCTGVYAATHHPMSGHH